MPKRLSGCPLIEVIRIDFHLFRNTLNMLNTENEYARPSSSLIVYPLPAVFIQSATGHNPETNSPYFSTRSAIDPCPTKLQSDIATPFAATRFISRTIRFGSRTWCSTANSHTKSKLLSENGNW